jgi:type II secretory pathway component GspD/PulD (secretin)
VDLPLIGRLFGTTRTSEQKRDLLILVTPHIIDEGERIGNLRASATAAAAAAAAKRQD